MKNFLFILVLLTAFFYPVWTSAQVLNLDGGTTRAVVIGISDYLEPEIPDLQYADKDAEAFANWLRSPAGGSIRAENLLLFTNQEATTAQIIVSIQWLIEESKSGDRAVIYLSGHGDVERVTKYGHGYFLGYDSPPKVYMSGAFSLRDLKDMVTTMSENGVQALVISDACRAGKLAGTEAGGTQATANQLAQQFNNEVLILSCQPEEFSLEGEQWGGGRGLFSYQLENALYGLADKNKDSSVDLREIRNYLEEKVPEEASPNRQMPLIKGPVNSLITAVDQTSLEKWQARLNETSPLFKDVVGKTMDSFPDSLLYRKFLAAIETGHLMAPVGESANDYYTLMVSNPEWERFHGPIKRKFVVALADEAQLVVNKLLRTDPQIIDEAFPGRVRYAHLPAYLSRAAEILGEQHYMYRYLKCKQFYFESKTFTKKNYPDLAANDLLQLKINALDKAIAQDENAAYAYLEKGIGYYWSAVPDSAQIYFNKAMEISPTWVLPVYYYGRTIWHSGNTALSLEYLKKALEYDSTFLPIYERLAFFSKSAEEKKFWWNGYVDKMNQLLKKDADNIPATYYRYMGIVLGSLGRIAEAEKFFLTGAEMTNYEDPLYYKLLAVIYISQKRYEEAALFYEKYLELQPNDPEAYHGSVEVYLLLNRPDKAVQFCEDALEIDSKNNFCSLFIANHSIGDKDYKRALQILEQSVDAQADKREHHLWLGKVNELLGRDDIALGYYQKLLEDNHSDINTNSYRTLAYGKLGPIEKFQGVFQLMENEWTPFYSAPGHMAYLLFYKSSMYGFLQNKEQCLANLEQAFQGGLTLPDPDNSSYWGSFNAPYFVFMRETPEFKALVKKYVPDYYKD